MGARNVAPTKIGWQPASPLCLSQHPHNQVLPRLQANAKAIKEEWGIRDPR